MLLRSRGRCRKTGLGEASQRGPAHALRAEESRNPDSEIHAALGAGKGQPKDEVAAPSKIARSEFKGVSCPKGKAVCLG